MDSKRTFRAIRCRGFLEGGSRPPFTFRMRCQTQASMPMKRKSMRCVHTPSLRPVVSDSTGVNCLAASLELSLRFTSEHQIRGVKARSDTRPRRMRQTHHFLKVLSWVMTHCGLAIDETVARGTGARSRSGSRIEESALRKRLCDIDGTWRRRVEVAGVDGVSGSRRLFLSLLEVGFAELWS